MTRLPEGVEKGIMLEIVVCIKQVPMVSELPWDPRTGTLKRELAQGMMNPACKHALEAALLLKEQHGARITTVTMGPPMAEEVVERRGGMLIHGAIIAPECRLPCVSGVPRVTELIHTGDRIAVDGSLGIVTVP